MKYGKSLYGKHVNKTRHTNLGGSGGKVQHVHAGPVAHGRSRDLEEAHQALCPGRDRVHRALPLLVHRSDGQGGEPALAGHPLATSRGGLDFPPGGDLCHQAHGEEVPDRPLEDQRLVLHDRTRGTSPR